MALTGYHQLQSEIAAFGLEDEVSLKMVGEYWSARCCFPWYYLSGSVIYGPVSPEDVQHLVEEHLYKGRFAADCKPCGELSGRIAVIRQERHSPAEKGWSRARWNH
jgi:hypothetical protein